MRVAQAVAGVVGIRRRRGDDGYLAGAESLVFGTLLFVLGTLVVINAWSVVDARLATSAAAREAVRAAIETPLDADPHGRAMAAGARAFAAHARDGLTLDLVAEIPPEWRRCAPVRYRAATTIEVAGLGLPGAARRFTVSAAYAEVVDPHRSGLPEGIDCGW